MSRRGFFILTLWALLVALATIALIATSTKVAHADVCCVSCHGPADCTDCHEPAEPEREPRDDAPAPPFDPDALTHSAFGPDGTYYVYVTGVHYEHEELEPGGLIYEAERIVGDSGCFEIVGPGCIIADDQDDAPPADESTAAIETTEEVQP